MSISNILISSQNTAKERQLRIIQIVDHTPILAAILGVWSIVIPLSNILSSHLFPHHTLSHHCHPRSSYCHPRSSYCHPRGSGGHFPQPLSRGTLISVTWGSHDAFGHPSQDCFSRQKSRSQRRVLREKSGKK